MQHELILIHSFIKKILLFLAVLLFLVFGIFGQKKSSKISKSKTSNSYKSRIQIQKGWRLVDLGNFSFLLPEVMKDQNAKGIDSEVWEFKDETMLLMIDSGMYKMGFSEIEEFENQKKTIKIDGTEGQYFYINFLKPKSPNSKIEKEEKEKPFAEGIIFNRGKNFYSSFWIQYKSAENQKIVKNILYSIKFKK